MIKRNHKPLLRELFKIYKIHRLIFIEIGLVFIASGLVPYFESFSDKANIASFGDGLWWALVTVTATGYGDFYPVTVVGRIIGTILMFSGIALFSTMIALVAAFYAHRRTKREVVQTQNQLDHLQKKVDNLGSKLDFLIKDKHKTK